MRMVLRSLSTLFRRWCSTRPASHIPEEAMMTAGSRRASLSRIDSSRVRT